MYKFEYRSPRFAVDLQARFIAEDSSIAGRCREISEGGMTLEHGSLLPQDSAGIVSVSYNGRNIEIQARVAHAGTRIRMRVVLPAPLGPRSAKTVPGSTESETSSRAWFEPNRFDTPWTSIAIIVGSVEPFRSEARVSERPLSMPLVDVAMATAFVLVVWFQTE